MGTPPSSPAAVGGAAHDSEDAQQDKQPPESQLFLAGALVQALTNSCGNQARGIAAARIMVSSLNHDSIDWNSLVTAFVERAEWERGCIHPSEEDEGNRNEDERQVGAPMQLYVSLSAICHHLIHGRIEKHGFSSMTFKVLTCHSDRSKWAEVKARRIHVMHEMFNFLQKEHKTMVFIEETHWMIGWQINHGHSPKGEKAFTNRMLACTSFLALAAITSSGHAYTLVVKGSVTGDVF